MLIAGKEEEGGGPNVYNAEQPRWLKNSHQLESPGQVEALCKLESSWVNQVTTLIMLFRGWWG